MLADISQEHSTAAAFATGMYTQPRVLSHMNPVPRHVCANLHICWRCRVSTRSQLCVRPRQHTRLFHSVHLYRYAHRHTHLAAQGTSVPWPKLNSKTSPEEKGVCHHPSPREAAVRPTQPRNLTLHCWQFPSKAPFHGAGLIIGLDLPAVALPRPSRHNKLHQVSVSKMEALRIIC